MPAQNSFAAIALKLSLTLGLLCNSHVNAAPAPADTTKDIPAATCYARTDPDFVKGAPNPKSIQMSSCAAAYDSFAADIATLQAENPQLWYTKSLQPPTNALGRNYKPLPLTQTVHGCALALMSSETLQNLTAMAGIAWRPEWGPAELEEPIEVFNITAPDMWLGLSGFSHLLDCAQEGNQPGHITLDSPGSGGQLHGFIWSGGESKFSQIYKIQTLLNRL